jgi:hypothetical protein
VGATEPSTTDTCVTDGHAIGLQAAKNCGLVHVDRFGRKVAEIAHRSWQQIGAGPTWREVLEAPEVHALMADIGVEPSRQSLQVLMARARGRLWIATTRDERSLCAGPRYFGGHGRSRRSADDVGRLVAQAVGNYRYQTHRSPAIGQLARTVRVGDGRQVFPGTTALQAELPWLITAGWIRLEGKEIRRGPTAKLDKQRRVDARRFLRESTRRPHLFPCAPTPLADTSRSGAIGVIDRSDDTAIV